MRGWGRRREGLSDIRLFVHHCLQTRHNCLVHSATFKGSMTMQQIIPHVVQTTLLGEEFEGIPLRDVSYL